MIVEIPGYNTTEEFPDDATPEQIQSVLAEKYPPTSEQISSKLKDPSTSWEDITFEEFQAYRKHESDITLAEGAGLLFDGIQEVGTEIAKGIPAAARAVAGGEVAKVGASVGEGAARGTLELGSLAAKIANNVGEFLIPGDDEAAAFSRFIGIKKLDNAVATARAGEGNLLEGMFLDEDVDQDLANALSNVLDPSMLAGGGAIGKAAAKATGKPLAVAGGAVQAAGGVAGRVLDSTTDKISSVKKIVGEKVPDELVNPTLGAGASIGAGLVGGAPAAGTAAAILTAPAVAQIAGGAVKGFGQSMQSAPTRLGAFQRTAASQPGTIAGKAAGRLTWLDGPLDAAGRAAGGAVAGGATGAALGGLAEGEEGFYSGIGAGAALGAAGSAASRVAGKISGKTLSDSINSDWQNWTNGKDAPTASWAKRVGRTDAQKAQIMDVSNLLQGATGEDVRIDVLSSRDYKAQGLGNTAGAFTIDGGKPTIRLNASKADAQTLAHESIHAMAKLDGFSSYVDDIKTAFGGKITPDGKTSIPGIYKQSELQSVFDRYRQRLPKEQRQVWDNHPQEAKLEELAADYFAAYVEGKNPNWILKGTRSNIPGVTSALNAADWLAQRTAADKLDRITGALETRTLGEIKRTKAIDGLLNDLVKARRKAYRSAEVISDRDFAGYTARDLGNDVTFQHLKDLGMAREDANGRRVLETNYRVKKQDKERSADLVARLRGVDGSGGLAQTESGFSGRWFSPEQFSAVLDSAFISDKVKQALASLNTQIAEGVIANITYGAATRRNRKGQAAYSSRIPVSNRDMIPMSLEISQAGNFNVKALDWSKLRTKAERYYSRDKSYGDAWKSYTDLKTDLLDYIGAITLGDKPTAELFGVSKRNLLNRLIGARNTKGNPELPAGLKFNEKENIWRDFRLDRLIDASPTNTKAKFDQAAYERAQINFSPAMNDSEYLSALNRGDNESAQSMVEDAAEANGYDLSHRRSDKQEPKDTGFITLLSRKNQYGEWENSHYGDNNFMARSGDLIDVSDLPDSITTELAEFYREKGLEEDVIGSPENLWKEIAPERIVDTAGMWDDPDSVVWFWEKYGEKLSDKGIFGINTDDGAVIFDPHSYKFKRGDLAVYDKQGNIVPLSERFRISGSFSESRKLNSRGGMLYKSPSGHRAIQISKDSKIKVYGPDGKRVGKLFDSIEKAEEAI